MGIDGFRKADNSEAIARYSNPNASTSNCSDSDWQPTQTHTMLRISSSRSRLKSKIRIPTQRAESCQAAVNSLEMICKSCASEQRLSRHCLATN
jgi:hypothetical protein